MKMPSKAELAQMTPEDRQAAVMAWVEAMESGKTNTDLLEHVEGHLKARTLTVTGDTGHMSIALFLSMFKDIDRPRKYDFQKENHYENEFFRLIERPLREIAYAWDTMPAEKFDAIVAGTDELVLKGTYERTCYDCATRINITIRGSNIHFSCDRPCESNRYFTVDVEFPTGEVVYCDWPYRFSEMQAAGCFSSGDFNVNTLRGERQTSEEMAKSGILHMFVGNSCPDLFVNPKSNAIHIGSIPDDDKASQFTGFERRGSFTTDLWWVTMVDKSRYDQWIDQLDEGDPARYVKNVTVTTVKPGCYRFTACYGMEPGLEDPHDTTTYVKAEYLGPCN